MRRRLPDLSGLLPPALADADTLPWCERWDSAELQRCSCWWARRASEWTAAGNEWPGGERCELADLFAMQKRFPCREPFDGTQV